MFGHFTENLNVSMLVEIILLIIGGGAMINSGLVRSAHNLIARRRLRYLERIGLGVVIAELVAFIVAVVLLAFIPHAVLLVSPDICFRAVSLRVCCRRLLSPWSFAPFLSA